MSLKKTKKIHYETNKSNLAKMGCNDPSWGTKSHSKSQRASWATLSQNEPQRAKMSQNMQ